MLEKKMIFFDTEFTNLDPYKGELLSIGMVKENGEELYLELEINPDWELSEWVRENILDELTAQKVSRDEAKEQISKFVGDDEPIMVTFVTQYDAIYFYKLYDGPETPFQWMPVDLSSMLFDRGYEPEEYLDLENGKIFRDLKIDTSKFNQHNALDDAKLVRETYLKLKNLNRK